MKKIICLVLLFCNIDAFCQCNEYVVDTVANGVVHYLDSKSPNGTILKKNFKVSNPNPSFFKFQSPNTFIKLHNKCNGGTILLTQKMEANRPKMGLIVFITGTGRATKVLSTKGDDYDKYLKSIFTASENPDSSNTLGIIGFEKSFQIDTTFYPLNSKNYFSVRLEINGTKYDKRVSKDGDKITFNKNELFEKNGTQISVDEISKMTLIYKSEKNSKPIKICDIFLHFETNEEIIKILSGI